MIISFLPWFLGLIIVFSKRETFLRLFSHLTGNEKYSRLWLALFYAGLILFPITVFLLLAYFQYKVNVLRRNKTDLLSKTYKECE